MSRAVTVACESPRSLNISTNATTGIIIAIAPKTSGASSLDNTTTEINCMQTRRACPALVERAPIVAWARIDPEALTMTFPSSDHLANPASYGQAGGTPRCLTAEHIAKAFQPMFGRSRNDQVSIPPFTGQLSAHPTQTP